MTDSISIFQALAFYALGQAITIGLAYYWAVRAYHAGRDDEARESSSRRKHELANQVRNANPRPFFHRSTTSRFHRE